MSEKKYLRAGQKIAYGLGDFGGNFCFTFVSSFVLIYLTDIVGLNSGIVGMLMLISKIFDGVSDVLFGAAIDRTHTRSGKAKPWFLGALLPLAVCTFLEFTIPAWERGLQYAYFFIVYLLLNAGFFTIVNVAYNTMTALITKNKTEQVQLGVSRYVFALAAAMAISVATPILVNTFGGGAAGWRMVALLYSAVVLIASLICGLSVKELPEEELYEQDAAASAQKQPQNFWKTLGYLFTNKYFLLLLGINIANQMMNAISQSVGMFYVTHILGDANAFGLFSMAGMLPMVIGLFLTPLFVRKFGMYKTNVWSLAAALVLGIPYIIIGMHRQLVLMLALLAVRGVFTSPLTGTLNALTAETSRNAYLKTGQKMEGSMFACSSMGIKVGSGIGLAVAGWLLDISGYDGLLAVQPDSALNMISIMYLVLPVISIGLQLLLMLGLNVEKDNARLSAAEPQKQ